MHENLKNKIQIICIPSVFHVSLNSFRRTDSFLTVCEICWAREPAVVGGPYGDDDHDYADDGDEDDDDDDDNDGDHHDDSSVSSNDGDDYDDDC